MGRSQRNKGNRREREFADLIGGHRVPLSGAQAGYPGDVLGLGLTWECKAREAGFKQLYAWLGTKDALALKADRKPWLVVLPLDKLLKEGGGVYRKACCVEFRCDCGHTVTAAPMTEEEDYYHCPCGKVYAVSMPFIGDVQQMHKEHVEEV